MKKLFLLLLLSFSFSSQSIAEECHCVNDNWGNYGCYTASGNECGSSRGGGSGDKIGPAIGFIIAVFLIYSFVKHSDNNNKEQKKTPRSKSTSNPSQRKFVVNDVKDEVANQKELPNQYNGKWNTYWFDKQIMTRENYIDGLKNGKQTSYYLSGSKESVENYIDGIKNGSSYDWFENGQIKRKRYYINGKQERVGSAWHKNGQKESEEYYVNGIKQKGSNYWDKNGTEQSIARPFDDDIPF